MKTRLIIISAIFMIAGQFAGHAQRHGNGKPDQEQMILAATDRMVKELALEGSTAADFSELYKAYLTEKFALMNEYRATREQSHSEQASEQIVRIFEQRQKGIELEQKQLVLDIQYCEKFNTILDSRQILKIYQRQNNFGRPQGGQRPYGRPSGMRENGMHGMADEWNEQ